MVEKNHKWKYHHKEELVDNIDHYICVNCGCYGIREDKGFIKEVKITEIKKWKGSSELELHWEVYNKAIETLKYMENQLKEALRKPFPAMIISTCVYIHWLVLLIYPQG